MIPPPGFQCREATNSAAVLAAVGGIGDCSPDDSGVAVTNLTACSSIYTIWLAFINQIKVAFCYIFGQLTDLQDQIDAISTMRTPGSVSIAAGASLGSTGSATISGNDTAGSITLIPGGAGIATGNVANLTFPTPYTTAGVMLLIPNNGSAVQAEPTNNNQIIEVDLTTSGGAINISSQSTQPLITATTYIWNYVVLGGT